MFTESAGKTNKQNEIRKEKQFLNESQRSWKEPWDYNLKLKPQRGQYKRYSNHYIQLNGVNHQSMLSALTIIIIKNQTEIKHLWKTDDAH